MHYGQESSTICCKLCQDGTGCQILSDTRAEGGETQPSHASLWMELCHCEDLVVWHVNAVLSNEVQVDVWARTAQCIPWEMEEMCSPNPNPMAVHQASSPASEASAVRTCLLTKISTSAAVATVKRDAVSQLSCSTNGLINHKQYIISGKCKWAEWKNCPLKSWNLYWFIWINLIFG